MTNFFSDAVKSGYFMYMAEASGRDDLVNTRTSKINAIANDVSMYKVTHPGYSVDPYISIAARSHGVSDLTPAEFQKIKRNACR